METHTNNLLPSSFHFIYTNANIDLEQSHEVSQKEEI